MDVTNLSFLLTTFNVLRTGNFEILFFAKRSLRNSLQTFATTVPSLDLAGCFEPDENPNSVNYSAHSMKEHYAHFVRPHSEHYLSHFV